MKKGLLLVVIGLFGLAAILTYASLETGDAGALAAKQGAGEEFDSGFSILRLVAVTGFVFLLLGGFAWFARKYGSGIRQAAGGAGNSIHVLESRMIAPRKSVVLVKIYDRVVALGVTDQSVHPVAEFTDEKIVSDAETVQTTPRHQPFSRYLKDILQ